ncbi:MAG: 3-isopropylmalate dehydratase large subunit, partial [Miltoncostaeaceae bacterium]
MAGKTLFRKVWDAHEVRAADATGPAILFVDLHLVHEVTSPQAFDGLRLAGRRVRRPDRTMSTVDHNVPTIGREKGIVDELSRQQVEALERNCKEFGIPLFSIRSNRQGIVHVIGPELGVTQPGMTIVCGDSHTSTHGAFGALAFGIGTSEVEHVLATQTLTQSVPKTMRINIDGDAGLGVGAKDLILGTIGQIGVSGAQGYVIEYAGSAIRALSMEGRMTVCNMSIEGGGRAGMIAPDETTYEWLEGRPAVPADFRAAVDHWRTLPSDADAVFDREVYVDAASLDPQVTWGTTPGMVAPISGRVPTPDDFEDPADRDATRRALEYMGLRGGEAMEDIALDTVFIGS